MRGPLSIPEASDVDEDRDTFASSMAPTDEAVDVDLGARAAAPNLKKRRQKKADAAKTQQASKAPPKKRSDEPVVQYPTLPSTSPITK